MIIVETVTINGKEFMHTYSDIGLDIERDGVVYSDAIDPIDSNRTYTEVFNEETDEEISTEEFMKLIEEAL